MRILFITHVADLYGANRSLLQLVCELRERGVEPYVVCRDDGVPSGFTLHAECKRLGIPCKVLHVVWFKDDERRTFSNALRFVVGLIVDFLRLAWCLRGERFDIVHSNASIIDLGAYYARFRGIPHVWHLREFGKEDFNMSARLGRWYERWTYDRRSTMFVAISKTIAEAFSQVINSEKIRLVYNGIVPCEAQLDAHHENRVVQLCVVGRVAPNKNQREVVEAVRMLVEDGISDFHLTLVGDKSSGYAAELERYVEDAGLASYVDFLGTRNDVPELLRGMDVGIVPSLCEAFGRVTVEFMMQGLAVVASDSGANVELVASGTTGLRYALGQPEDLKQQLRLLVTDRPLMLRLAKAGQQVAREKFSSLQNSRGVYELYSEMLRSKEK